MANTLYTIGYEESDAATFLKKVEGAGVRTVLDVRELPQSRIPGFSKTALSTALGQRNIKYVHVRELGSPRELRHALREDGDFTAFTRGYLLYLKKQREHIEAVKKMAYTEPCCLLCFEKDHNVCHRKFVALEVKSAARNGLQIVHL
ncbi:MAG: DUF488 domain-containing protein [Verrucomicrobiia bacterium]|jgi:uncharacterized protein (DUF488 family)